MFPLIETAIAFAAAMLAASLFVSAVVQGIQNFGQYRSEIVERMLKSVIHGFRSFYNDIDVLTADGANAAVPKLAPEKLAELRGAVLETEHEFVADVLSDPALHARLDGASYGGDPETLARTVEYIDAGDLVTIARNQGESMWLLRTDPTAAADVSSPMQPTGTDTPGASGAPVTVSTTTVSAAALSATSVSATTTLPIAASDDAQRYLPPEWFFPKAQAKSAAQMATLKPYATVAKFAEYVERWFPTFEATASETFKKRMRRLTLVVSCTVVVLFNLDGFALASKLYGSSGKSDFAARIPDLQAQAARLGVVAASVEPATATETTALDLGSETSSLLRALDSPDLGLGWQSSAIVDQWCAYSGKCPSTSPAISRGQVAKATIWWLLGLAFSCAMLSMGAPFWYNVLSGLLNLKSSVQTSKQRAADAVSGARASS
jgi:hypothetical protein